MAFDGSSFFRTGLRFAMREATDRAANIVDSDPIPAPGFGLVALRNPLHARMSEQVGSLEYWEWRIPENLTLTDLVGQRDNVADALGVKHPETWGELVAYAVVVVNAMRTSPEFRQGMIDFEQTDENARRAAGKLDSIKKIALIGGLVAGALGIAGIVSAVKGEEVPGEIAQPPTEQETGEIAAPQSMDLTRVAVLGGALLLVGIVLLR